jgi:hypothetical protein
MRFFQNIKQIFLAILLAFLIINRVDSQDIKDFIDPPREFSIMPFWFWNDTLKDEEIVRQIADFEAHGVYGFVIHPRIGLPENIKWLSAEMIYSMEVAIQEASYRNMKVILYDEGMYPSGSSSGQVVERNPAHAARGLAKIDLKPGEELKLHEGVNLITVVDRPGGDRVAIVDQPSGGSIRGLHYIDEGSNHMKEETPPAGDILNPEAVTSFIDLVYDRYAREFGKYFGTTIIGIFTDEPSPLGRDITKGMVPGNIALLAQINRIIGYNITPFLADLWYNDYPESEKHHNDYFHAINVCLEENYYLRLGNWCKEHGISLMGHPAGSMDIGSEKYFQIPGQDLVWRYVEPGPKALKGQHSTMAKCASSSMLHFGLRRNSNELYGAYGHNLTYDEMVWLANWCFVRGQNLLIPHAFYYSVRGPRFDERPPDVGPNSSWWNDYNQFANACRRLSWLNTDSRQVCDLAILCESNWLPDESAKICYNHQRDFNYLELNLLYEGAKIDSEGVHIAGMTYGAIIIDSLTFIPPKAVPALEIIAGNGRLIINEHSQFAGIFEEALIYKTAENLISEIDRVISPDLTLINPSDNIRYRHVVKGDDHYYILFNEEKTEVKTKIGIPVKGKRQFLNPSDTGVIDIGENEIVNFRPHELKILHIK